MKENLLWLGMVPAVAVVVIVLVSVVSTNNRQPQTTDSDSSDVADIVQEDNKQGEVMKLEDFEPLNKEATELEKIDLEEGDGAAAPEGATVTVHYTGAYGSNGEIFESSKSTGSPVTFSLSEVIPGWTEGVPGMKVGGIRRLIIPGAMAYGEAPEGYTPGSTPRPMGTLVFDIELIDIAD